MKPFFLIALLCLCSCTGHTGFGPDEYLKKTGFPLPTTENFVHCYQYGCQKTAYISLNEDEQSQIKSVFTGNTSTPESEKLQISKAIGLFERIIGAKTGTEADHFGTFRANGQFQQDCVDESVNTTIYLRLLENMDLLQYHKVSAPDTRFPLIHGGRWPHRTAVIIDKDSGQTYAVDSWFHDNGFDAEIISLKDWKKGWKPEYHKRKGDDFSSKP